MRQVIATLRHRPAPLAGSFVALAAAAMLITWVLALGAAASSSKIPAGRLAGTAVAVLGSPRVAVTSGKDQGTDVLPLPAYRRVPATLALSLASVPGVRAAVADQSVPVALELPGGRVVTGSPAGAITGHGWQSAQLAPFTLRAGHAPSGTGQLVLGAGVADEAGLAVGDQVRLAGQQQPPFTIVGIAAARAGLPASGQAVFFSAAEAAALYGHPAQADLIGIVAQPGTGAAALAARVREAIAAQHLTGGQQLAVVYGSKRGTAADLAEAGELANLSGLAGGIGIPIVLISLFVVATTIALSVGERAAAMALLRAVGATGGQVRRMVMAELAALGLLGGLAGFLPGAWIARLSVHGLAAHQLAPASARARTSPWELLATAGAAIVVAEISGLLAARRASRIRPVTALQEASIERRRPRPLRLLLGLAAIAGGIVLSVIALRQADAVQQLEQAQFALLSMLAGLAFLGPYLMIVAEFLLRLPLRLMGAAPGRLASAAMRSRSRRMAAAAMAVALPVTFAGAIVTIDSTQVHASVTEGVQRLAAGAVVTAPGPGLDPSALTAIRAQAGVRGAAGLIPTTVFVPDPGAENAAAEAVTTGPLRSLLHLRVVAGSLARFGPGDIALSNLVAGRGAAGVHVGQTITTYLADGTSYRATVTAVFTRSLGFADAVVPVQAAGGGHLGTRDLGEVLVAGSPGVQPGNLTRQVASLSGRYPGLQITSRSLANAQYQVLTSQTSYANDLALTLIGLLAAVALVNTLVLTTLQGREELGLLYGVGASSRQLIAMAGWQAAAVALTGVLLGAAAAAPAVAAVARALTGSPAPHVSGGAAALVLGVVAALTGTAVLVPTARMLRQGQDA
jgi:putative ABC transport system permease protein